MTSEPAAEPTPEPTPEPTREPTPQPTREITPPGGLPPLPENIWLHGLTMAVLVVLVNLAQLLIGVTGLIQFLWMLIAKERNAALAEFGEGLGRWLATAARFVGGASDARPFPWSRWG